MITSLYAGFFALFLTGLSLNVIRLRKKHKIRVGDGNVLPLQLAKATQTNAAEYCPFLILLLALAEFNGLSAMAIHGFGCLFIVARLIHAYSVLSDRLPLRIIGMQLTFFNLISLGVLNILNAIHLF